LADECSSEDQAADSRGVQPALQAVASLCLGLADCEEPFAKASGLRDNFGCVRPARPSKLCVCPMSRNPPEVAILLADICGSTPLYEAIGDPAAARQIVACRDELRSIIARRGGTFIQSRGDDVLCTFADPSSALRAARELLAPLPASQLAIHGGMHVGPVVHAHGDIFGDAVNLTARLAALARPGEILTSKGFVDSVPPADRSSLRVLDTRILKGKGKPTEIYSLASEDSAVRTEVVFGHGSGHTRTKFQQVVADAAVTLRYAGCSCPCQERVSLSIGRSAECDLVIERPWVSRQHAVVTVRGGKVELEDRSSLGTYVSPRGGHEFFMRRETVVLTGSGTISPAMRSTDANAEVVHYEVVGRQSSKPQQRAKKVAS
jgi:adenylate cyclase